MRKLLLLFCTLLFWQVNVSAQAERILDYHTLIDVQSDRSVIITETIEVYATGRTIKRGITRRLPGNRDLKGRTVNMNYKILEVKKNGASEPYIKKFQNEDLMLYFGSKNVFLTPGVYTYLLKYEVSNQIGFYDTYDEIYWNAIGTDVSFEIEKASCSVLYPVNAQVVEDAAYVGSYGKGVADITPNKTTGQFNYQVTRKLQPGEGLTVAIGFEKGLFEQPGFFARMGTLLLILIGTLFLLPYYFSTWRKYGQDPPTPAAYPLWDTPDDLSAAAINYIDKGNYQSTSFTASVISLAVKGYLKIEEIESSGFFTSSKNFELIKIKSADASLPTEEAELMNNLFGRTKRVSIDGQYDSKIERTYAGHKSNLKAQFWEFIHKGDNSKLLWLPILITVAIAGCSILVHSKSPYAEGINFTALLVFVPAALLAFFLYVYLIKKPTVEKLELRSRIAGFRMYLELAEKDRLNLLNPPELTPAHFEKALPFAIALGVGHQWTAKFETILKQAQYRPDWNNSSSPIYFSNNFNQGFARNVQGSSTKPSSSGGGSGGGGFSGGGGGGGGVGGW